MFRVMPVQLDIGHATQETTVTLGTWLTMFGCSKKTDVHSGESIQ